jgi:hypothetical protein
MTCSAGVIRSLSQAGHRRSAISAGAGPRDDMGDMIRVGAGCF